MYDTSAYWQAQVMNWGAYSKTVGPFVTVHLAWNEYCPAGRLGPNETGSSHVPSGDASPPVPSMGCPEGSRISRVTPYSGPAQPAPLTRTSVAYWPGVATTVMGFA